MALPQYPASPTTGDTFTVGIVTFRWDGEKWKSIAPANHEQRITDIEDKSTPFYFDTVAEAIADTTLVVGDVVIIEERANGIFNVISGTSTANTYNIIAHGSLSLSLELRVKGAINVCQFGATGDGSTDDYGALQHCLDLVAITGGAVYFPRGDYKVLTGLVVPTNWSATPATDLRRVSIFGDGQGCTSITTGTDAIIGMLINGDDVGTVESHGYFTIEKISFTGASPTSRTDTGLKLQSLAYIQLRDVSFHNLEYGLNINGVLSSGFYGLSFDNSTNGVFADEGTSFSHENANLWSSCIWRSITNIGYDGRQNSANVTFSGCNFEACGTMGTATSGAVSMVLDGTNGDVGANFIGCYFEINRGGFDVKLTNAAASRSVVVNLTGCNLQRVNNTDYVTNNIAVTGSPLLINTIGCSFSNYSTYVPDAARMCISLPSNARHSDVGSIFTSSVDSPTNMETTSFAGFVDGSAGASVATSSVLPNGWTVTQAATGRFTVTHNIGHTNYSVNATCSDAVGNFETMKVVKTTTNFQVTMIASGGTVTLTDKDFDFTLTAFAPIV